MSRKKILKIFRHELSAKRRSSSLWLIFLMMQLLLAIALLTGWQQYKHNLDAQQTAQSLVEKQWQNQPDRHPHRVAHFGHFAFRPPGALSFFDMGVNSWVGNSIFLEAHKQNSANFASDEEASNLLRFSELTSANILLLIWPLLLIALGFSTVCGEKRAGTLRQLMSMGVSFRHLIIGKGLAYLLLSLVFIMPVFLLTFALSLESGSAISGEEGLRVVLLLASYLLYCIFWIILILLVSSLVTYPRQALIILVSLWFVLTILMPRTLADIANQQFSHLKRNDFELAIKLESLKVGDSHNPDDPYFNQFRIDTLEKYGVDTVEALPVNYRGLIMTEGERLTAQIYGDEYKKQLAQFDAQQTFISRFYWINPYLMTRDLSMALAGTDSRHFFNFEQQAERNRYQRTQMLNELHTHQIAHKHDRGQTIDREHWMEFTGFSYQKPDISWSLQAISFKWAFPVGTVFLLFALLISGVMQRRIYATV